MHLRRLALPLATVTLAAAALAGCAPAADETDGGTIRIVASTNVYADIAQTIAGDSAEVTAIITDSSQDPHEYEAGSRDALAISQADLVILNGGGYDEFMETILNAQDTDPEVIDVVELSGLDEDADEDADHDHADEHAADDEEEEEHHHDHGAFNEHLWYNLTTMAALAHEIAHELGELLPDDADTFEAAADSFAAGLAELETRTEAIAAEHAGTGVAITEPVPLYLLEAAGLEDLTPADFSEAIEEGTDAPALVLQEVLTLVSDGSVAFLAYNEQTVGPQTEQVLAAAEAAGTAVVSFSELLPDGLDYLGWMAANLDAIEAALGA